MSFDSSFYDNSTDNIVENNVNAGQDDLSGFLRVLGEMELIISSKGGGQEYSVDTCSDLDDILPTMLVCKQFFAGKHLTILCKGLSGFILGNLNWT